MRLLRAIVRALGLGDPGRVAWPWETREARRLVDAALPLDAPRGAPGQLWLTARSVVRQSAGRVDADVLWLALNERVAARRAFRATP